MSTANDAKGVEPGQSAQGGEGAKVAIASGDHKADDLAMDHPISKTKIAGRVVIAHAAGLLTAGIFLTIGTTAGISVFGGGLGLVLGGVLSIPWIAALVATIWFYGGWIEKHPFLFSVMGPMAVCGSYALLAGAFLDAVAVSSITSSACYLALALWGTLRSTKATTN